MSFSLTGGEDRLIWSFRANGVYLVKSGYVEALKANESAAPKIRHFWWKVFHNAGWLLEKTSLLTNVRPPLCEVEIESVEHILFCCD